MISLTISSAKKTNHYQKLASLTLPAWSGEMQVLPDHAEIFVLLLKGEIRLKSSNDKEQIVQIAGNSVCHIKDNQVIIIH